MELVQENETSPIRKKRNKLLFGVRRSIRYHMRRRKFFDRLDFWTRFLTVVTGGGTVISATSNGSHDSLVIVFGSLVAFFTALDLVIGCSGVARDHHDLIRKFSYLERQITKAGNGITEQEVNGFVNQRLEIEEDEPPHLRVLNILCHNELVKASGYDKKHLVHVGRFARFVADVFDFGADKLEKQMDKSESTA
jgi:hypothetical protein